MTDDLISRQEAIAHLKQRLYETQFNNDTEHPYYEEIADNRIDVWKNEVPSVQPEQKHGKWIVDALADNIYRCSECGIDAPVEPTGGTEYKSNYCPNCGAKMDMKGE